MALFNPSRDQVRLFFFDSWAKFNAQQPLTDLEKLAVEVMQMHPEYHHVLNAPETYLDQSYFPEMGETNPFLHMSLHLSVLEQVAIDQPPGINAAYHSLWRKYDDAYTAQHDLMECLAETIWQAQRQGQPLDVQAYIDSIEAKVRA
ncbi:DUF1841 family protein [Methylobacillus arboreus]|uniref:DUF1841 family protein n=1 Tax=Methylobacillus arboreus TaxID=755170 RepID=UPI001E62B503|nr:DUF1841 family protein [Methylobacillus arboreus]MCB5191672.1 DUF1841 family protein [Methylobacillus arboreus]